MSRERVWVRRGDYARVLFTETTPDEVPVLIGNAGVYHWAVNSTDAVRLGDAMNRFAAAFLPEAGDLQDMSSKEHEVAYQFEIRSGDRRCRVVSLPHPRSQLRWASLYRAYDEIMVYHCANSEYSLRAPTRVAEWTYADGAPEGGHASDDSSASYFVYRHQRLHEFLESDEVVDLESRYSHLLFVDVENCFGSVYTHSLEWAIYGKEAVKRNRSKRRLTFGRALDLCMSKANWAETNGVIIGPEVSRLVVEVLFQDLDRALARELEAIQARDGDICIRRYVDDYMIFGVSRDSLAHVESVLENVLTSRAGLRLNHAKRQLIERPFVTARSRAVAKLRDVVDELKSSLDSRLCLKGARSPSRPQIKRRFIGAVRRAVSERASMRGLEGTFALKCVATEVRRVLSARNDDEPDERQACAEMLLELAFHCLKAAPTASGSADVCESVLLYREWLERNGRDRSQGDRRVFLWSCALLDSLACDKVGLGVEGLNIIAVLAELGDDNRLGWGRLYDWFDADSLSYFEVVTLLRYAGLQGLPDDRRIQDAIEGVFTRRKAVVGDIRKDSEAVHLIFDLVSCPYIDRDWLKGVLKEVASLSSEDAKEVCDRGLGFRWFMGWEPGALAPSLRRRRRRAVY